MAHILSFNSLAYQESALHGLGQWQGTHDRQVPAIIDGFLGANPDIDPRLIRYAKAARCGCVLQTARSGSYNCEPSSSRRQQFVDDALDPGSSPAAR
jgi:hypothetical protein